MLQSLNNNFKDLRFHENMSQYWYTKKVIYSLCATRLLFRFNITCELLGITRHFFSIGRLDKVKNSPVPSKSCNTAKLSSGFTHNGHLV